MHLKSHLRLLKWFGRLAKWLHPSETQATLLGAALVGCVGGGSAILFRQAVQWVLWGFTRHTGNLEQVAAEVTWWQRLLVPAIGGLLAGTVLYFSSPSFLLVSPWEIGPYLLMGLGLGVAAPGFVRLLRKSEDWFTALVPPVALRLALGGLLVGALAIPVLNDNDERVLLGYISKTDLLLTLAHGLRGGPH